MSKEQSKAQAGRVLVFARTRPLLDREAGDLAAVDMNEDDDTVVVHSTPDPLSVLKETNQVTIERKERSFKVDGAFPEEACQKEVFQRVGLPVLVEVMKGFNGCIFAYGQTGSGKTYSLLHSEVTDMEHVGILPRLVATLFARAAMDKNHVYTIQAAAFQVYNEQVDDLLNPEHRQGAGQNLSITNKGEVQQLTWKECKTPAAMMDAFKRARSGIHYAETKMNKSSSRSHAVFQTRIIRRRRAGRMDGKDGKNRMMQATCGQLSVVDLAGSERVKRSGVTGSNFKEATNINGSLLALGNVIQALADKRKHVPFRDSKLTRILEGSVGGNCKTSLLVCVSPSDTSTSETLSTLEFASRAMRVEVDAKVNETVIEIDASLLAADLEEENKPQIDEAMLKTFRESEQALQQAQAKVEEQEKFAASMKLKVNDMTNAIQEKSQALDKACSENRRLSLQTDTLAKQLESVSKTHSEEISRVENIRESLKKQLEKSGQEIESTKSELKTLKQEYATQEQERKALDKTLGELKLELVTAQEIAKKKLEDCEKVKTEWKEDRRKLLVKQDSLEKEVGKEREEKTKLQVNISRLTKQKSVLETKIGKLSEDMATSHDKLQAEEAKVRQLSVLQEQIVQLGEQLTTANATGEELNTKVEELTATNKSLSNNLEYVEKTSNERQILLDLATEKRTTLEADKRELEHTIAAIQEDLAKSHATASRTEEEHTAEIDTLKKTYEMAINEMKETLKAEVDRTSKHGMEALQALEVRAQQDSAKLQDKIRAAERHLVETNAVHSQKIAQIMEQHATELAAANEKEKRSHAKQVAHLQDQIQQGLNNLLEAEKSSMRREEMMEEHHVTSLMKSRVAYQASRVGMSMQLKASVEKYNELNQRFINRESRKDDLEEIAKQKKEIKNLTRKLKETKSVLAHKKLELDHIMANVRIFGQDQSSRRSGTAIPGQKVGERDTFKARRAKTPVLTTATTTNKVQKKAASRPTTPTRTSISYHKPTIHQAPVPIMKASNGPKHKSRYRPQSAKTRPQSARPLRMPASISNRSESPSKERMMYDGAHMDDDDDVLGGYISAVAEEPAAVHIPVPMAEIRPSSARAFSRPLPLPPQDNQE